MRSGALVPAGMVAVVVTAIVVGLLVTGTPQHQRELRQDEQRVSDLARLARSLSRFYADTDGLPEALATLVDGRILTSLPRDPQTEASYGYEITGPMTFRLCAAFSHADQMPRDGEFFAHSAGRNCFDFDYSALRLD